MAESKENPLRRMNLTRVSGYDEFVKKWNSTDDFDEKRGLLHGLLEVGRSDVHTTTSSGFMVLTEWSSWKKEDVISMIIFLFEIADGYLQSRRYFQADEDALDISGMRLVLAQKAISILCLEVFRESKRHLNQPSYRWDILIGEEKVFTKLLWFFREVKCDDGYHLFNVPDKIRSEDHLGQNMRKFLVTLLALVWGQGVVKVWDAAQKRRIEDRLFGARPSFITITQYLYFSEFINVVVCGFKLDPASLAALEHLALRGPFQFSDGLRPARNLGEACTKDSYIAQFLAFLGLQNKP